MVLVCACACSFLNNLSDKGCAIFDSSSTALSISSLLSDLHASSTFSIASFKDLDSSSDNSSLLSSIAFFVELAKPSAIFLEAINSSNFLSSSALISASFTIFSISSSDNPLPPCIVIDCSLFVDLSLADTFIIPLASISKVTSI